MDKLLLIDGNSLVNRAYFALPPLNDDSGRNVNAVYGFINLLLSAISAYQPTKLIVAFDAGGHNFRKDVYSQYKANRKGMPDDLAVQMPILEEVLSAMSITFVKQRGVEADDIIGTLTNRCSMPCVVVTGDKDMLQLVDGDTSIAITKRGIADVELVTPDNIVSLYGYTASQVVEYKALRGDTSDNIPGVKGVGDKTALTLLTAYTDIDGVYNNIDSVKGAMKDKLIADKGMAYISKQLATILRDIDIECDIETCNLPVYSDRVRQLFTKLQFKSIVSRISFDEESTPTREIARHDISDMEQLREVVTLSRNSGLLACYICKDTIELAVDEDNEYIISLNNLLLDFTLEDIYKELSVYMNDSTVDVVLFDNKQFRHHISKYGVTIPLTKYDLALMQYIVLPRSNKTMSELCTALDLPISSASMITAKGLLWEKLVEQNAVSLYVDVELPLSEVLYDMELAGVAIDVEQMSEVSTQLRSKIDALTTEIHQLAGEQFNVASPKQLSAILFEKLGLTHYKKTSRGYSTNSDVLNKLVDEHPIIAKIIEYRQIAKIFGTSVEGLRPLIVNSRVHTTYNNYLTTTGRLSSSEPNLQNIPIRSEQGKEIRKLYVSSNGTFVGADYSQIELRLLASFSNDTNLISAFVEGRDIHAYVASDLMSLPIEMINSDMRRMAKAVNFGIIYGISDFGLSENTGLTVKKAHKYIEMYFERYPTIKQYLDKCVADAKSSGYVTTMLGRRRYIPEINSSNFAIRGFGERAAMNMPLQGSSADIIKIAMINIAKAFKQNNIKSQLLLQIHDEVIVDAYPNEVEQVKQIIVDCMQNAVSLNCPLIVNVEEGASLYEV